MRRVQRRLSVGVSDRMCAHVCIVPHLVTWEAFMKACPGYIVSVFADSCRRRESHVRSVWSVSSWSPPRAVIRVAGTRTLTFLWSFEFSLQSFHIQRTYKLPNAT